MKVIGHRGARGLAPENTLAGLQKALDHGADGIEFDLRVTADGIVVVHHDAAVTDPDGDRHVIAKTDFASLKEHKPDLTTFEEVLKQFAGKTLLYAEIKPDVPTKPIIKLIEKAQPKQLWLASFSYKTLFEFKAALPGVPLVINENWSGVRAGRRARQLDTKLVAMNQRWLWWGFIRASVHGGTQLYTYTLNNPRKAARWTRWGLAGVITDYPDRFSS